MGTRGLRLVRYKRRYWAYFNRFDSYPEVLGESIVDKIPVEPEEYQEWLAKMREDYQQKTEILEALTFVIPVDEITKGEDEEDYRDDGSYVPRELCNQGLDIFIEWTYLIDLDEERFVINGQLEFGLQNIPRDRWLMAFTANFDTEELAAIGAEPGDGDKVELSCLGKDDLCQRALKFCPEATWRESLPRWSWLARRPFDCTTATAFNLKTVRVLVDLPDVSLQSFVALLMFNRLYDSKKPIFREYLHDIIPASFAFRELAFLVLSLAANQFYFHRFGESGRRPELDELNYLRLEGKCIPAFGAEHHLQGVDAGSAPLQEMYWFEGVLVKLVTDEMLEHRLGTVQTSVIECCLAQGRSNFQVILFSLWHAVLFEVVNKNDQLQGRSSGILPVCSLGRDEEEVLVRLVGLPKNEQDLNSRPLTALQSAHFGFAALQKFFDTAARRQMAGCKMAWLPDEISALILSCCDIETRNIYAKVCPQWRSMTQHQYLFSTDLELLNIQTPPADGWSGWKGHERTRKRRDMGIISFFDHVRRMKMATSLRGGFPDYFDLSYHPRKEFNLHDEPIYCCPVIGSGNRPSLVTELLWSLARKVSDMHGTGPPLGSIA